MGSCPDNEVSVQTPNTTTTASSSSTCMARYERVARRALKRRCLDTDFELNQTTKLSEERGETWQQGTVTTTTAEKTCQTALIQSDITQLESCSCELKALKAEHTELKAKYDQIQQEKMKLEQSLASIAMTQRSFKDNDEKVRFYTGLTNWNVLLSLFTFVQPHLSTKVSLPPFEQLILTFMRLRLSLVGQDLGYRFGLHPSTVSRIFTNVLEVLYQRLNFLIMWPEREILRRTLPVDFRKHCPKCVVIIDCFEIFIDRPTDLLARAQTYSQYKSHNTIKYLIGVTPQGTVSYISSGWGGRVSDKYLTENCGLLDQLLPGDTVLADRGFNIQESVGLYMATITIPASMKNKKQLTGVEVEQTRNIANVRIHVERIIGNIRKKYTFLSNTQPVDFVIRRETTNNAVLDMAVTVCYALNNICNSVVPFD